MASAISARPCSSWARISPGASAASFSATKVASLGLSAARYASVARIAASTCRASGGGGAGSSAGPPQPAAAIAHASAAARQRVQLS